MDTIENTVISKPNSAVLSSLKTLLYSKSIDGPHSKKGIVKADNVIKNPGKKLVDAFVKNDLHAVFSLPCNFNISL